MDRPIAERIDPDTRRRLVQSYPDSLDFVERITEKCIPPVDVLDVRAVNRDRTVMDVVINGREHRITIERAKAG